MLATLLPGFRHFRTPFAIGTICALQLWLLFGKVIPAREEAHGFMRRAYSLGDMAGRPIVVSFIAFSLYLLGDVAKIQTVRVASLAARYLGPRFSPVSVRTYHALHELANRVDGDRDTFPSDFLNNVESEFPEIRMRLIANHFDVYMEHDRLDSEAEFRVNISLYSSPLWLSLSLMWSPWVLFGFIPSVVLFLHGIRALRESNAILVQGLVAGLVESRNYNGEESRHHLHGG
ncbi:hypothetical protein AB0G67_09495 [Streptomyces sp. NPDC021056]|uniref:hypothetical protein n=1 Tax=Streptomyces sp. NPDC021056 TaxID=3155012 RepID=UPI0033D8C99C